MNLQDAIRFGKADAVAQLLKMTPTLANQPDDRGFPPLVLATYMNQKKVAEVLIENGADINAQDAAVGNTALMGVAFKGNEEMVQLLIDKGADVNIQNSKKATALIFAVTFGHVGAAKILLDSGANASLTDDQGNTALHHAQKQGNDALQILLSKNK